MRNEATQLDRVFADMVAITCTKLPAELEEAAHT